MTKRYKLLLRANLVCEWLVSTIVRKLRARSIDKHYSFLHLRIEADWILHCKRWENIKDRRVRNNCANNTGARAKSTV